MRPGPPSVALHGRSDRGRRHAGEREALRRPSARLEREGASADVGLSPPCWPGGSARPGDEPISARNTTDLDAGFDLTHDTLVPWGL